MADIENILKTLQGVLDENARLRNLVQQYQARDLVRAKFDEESG